MSRIIAAFVAGVLLAVPAVVIAQDVYVIVVRHDVTDFVAWKKVFDGGKPDRDKAGMKDVYVLRDNDKPNFVTVVHETTNLDKVKAFMGSPGLKEKMSQAGVMGPPDIKIGVQRIK